MANPGKPVSAELRYELKLWLGPSTVKIRGESFDIPAGGDMAVIARIVTSNGMIVNETPVAVVGNEWRTDATEFLRLRDFLDNGGVVGLARDLVFR